MLPRCPPELAPEHRYIESLHRAIVEAQAPAIGTISGEMAFADAARDRWEDFYVELAMTPRLGLAGAVTGRHEAQVARLALVYALADRSAVVGRVHLEAAIALADYARRSATWALGDSTATGTPTSFGGCSSTALWHGRKRGSRWVSGLPRTWPRPSLS